MRIQQYEMNGQFIRKVLICIKEKGGMGYTEHCKKKYSECQRRMCGNQNNLCSAFVLQSCVESFSGIEQFNPAPDSYFRFLLKYQYVNYNLNIQLIILSILSYSLMLNMYCMAKTHELYDRGVCTVWQSGRLDYVRQRFVFICWRLTSARVSLPPSSKYGNLSANTHHVFKYRIMQGYISL